MQQNYKKMRTPSQKIADFISFPLRAFTLFEKDKWGLSSLASERFYYAAEKVCGYCLDVGCGKWNRFVTEFLNGNGKGIDVYGYEGLTEENIVEDISHFPFEDQVFNSVTFLANLNHVPRSMRDIELAEAYRCLKPGGNIVVTMGNPFAEILVHKVIWFYDKYLGSNVDMDSERGMHEEEEYYLLDREIKRRLSNAGFNDIRKKYFWTQWCLNHMLIACK
ncbi:MAG: class I SAM-dependent methyltransferase [Planctomycetes bacterium]|nr:class I SAM-dependent methyltransferase [Planctomycetota bacterium]